MMKMATSPCFGLSSASKLKAVARRNGNMTANDKMSNHLRPLLSIKKYATTEDLAKSVLLSYVEEVEAAHKKFATPNAKKSHKLPLFGLP